MKFPSKVTPYKESIIAKKSSDYKHIRAAKNKTEYEDNEKRTDALKTREQELAEQSDKGLLDLNSFQARRLSELDGQLIKYRREEPGYSLCDAGK